MLCEVIVSSIDPESQCFIEVHQLAGPATAVAKDVAGIHADYSRLCFERELITYSLLTVFFDSSGKVKVA